MSGTTGGFPYQIKTTTESTDSNKRTNSEVSDKHYMRHTSSSEQRAKSRTFGKSPKNLLRPNAVGYNLPPFVGANPNLAQLHNYNNLSNQYSDNTTGAARTHRPTGSNNLIDSKQKNKTT